MQGSSNHRVDDVALELQAFLLSRPTLDEVSRIVTALLWCFVEARGALIVSMDGPRIAGRWLRNVPGWQTTEAALSAHLCHLAENPGQVHPISHPSVTSTNALATVTYPLGLPHEPLGVFALVTSLNADHAVVCDVARRVADVLSLYVAGAELSLNGDDPSHRTGSGEPKTMSERQLEVLDLMASGHTLGQIARRLGFSESTIRAESLNIYRFLGVHDRHRAVAVAGQLGLLGAGALSDPATSDFALV